MQRKSIVWKHCSWNGRIVQEPKIQYTKSGGRRLDTAIANITAESLNFWGNNNIATSKKAGVLPSNAKTTNKGRFCIAKTFIRNNNAGDRLTASWSAIVKQETEKKNGVHNAEV